MGGAGKWVYCRGVWEETGRSWKWSTGERSGTDSGFWLEAPGSKGREGPALGLKEEQEAHLQITHE